MNKCIDLPDNLENFKGNININCCCCGSGKNDKDSCNDEKICDCKCRVMLEADTDFFVRTDGNDINDGLADNPQNAFATVQGAYDAISNTYDFAGYKLLYM